MTADDAVGFGTHPARRQAEFQLPAVAHPPFGEGAAGIAPEFDRIHDTIVQGEEADAVFVARDLAECLEIKPQYARYSSFAGEELGCEEE
jgi:hypothetical protein